MDRKNSSYSIVYWALKFYNLDSQKRRLFSFMQMNSSLMNHGLDFLLRFFFLFKAHTFTLTAFYNFFEFFKLIINIEVFISMKVFERF